MSSPRLICITGGSSVGKSTTLGLLSSLFPIVREAATDVIAEGKIHPVNDFERFQEEIYWLQTIREGNALVEARGEVIGYCDHDEPIRLGASDFVICDRGIYDTWAYSKMHGKPLPPYIGYEPGKPRYPLVFLLEPLDFFEENGIRYEDLEFTKTITPILEEMYSMTGSRVIRVPKDTPENRVDMIINSIHDFIDEEDNKVAYGY